MTSKASRRFLIWARITLVLVYLVIIAGSVVRATGSGMGCPDWPKCFGHLIPPTQVEQLQYEEGKVFRKGHFIIWQESLWKARRSLTATRDIDLDDWEKYTKHDYARFNVLHTWTEYLNRLMGALLGLASLAMLFSAFGVRRQAPSLPWLCGLTVFLIGFEAWLGATVVESVLEPAKITTHMLGALVIVGVVLTTLARARRLLGSMSQVAVHVPSLVLVLLLAAMGATIMQIVAGTQVREQVDALDKIWNGQQRERWPAQLHGVFHFHRAFAYGLVLVNGAALFLIRRRLAPLWPVVGLTGWALVVALLIAWGSGAALYLMGMPAWIQPVHLVIATFIFGLQFRLWTLLRSS